MLTIISFGHLHTSSLHPSAPLKKVLESSLALSPLLPCRTSSDLAMKTMNITMRQNYNPNNTGVFYYNAPGGDFLEVWSLGGVLWRRSPRLGNLGMEDLDRMVMLLSLIIYWMPIQKSKFHGGLTLKDNSEESRLLRRSCRRNQRCPRLRKTLGPQVWHSNRSPELLSL